MRKILIALVTLAGAIFIISRFEELGNIYATVQRGDARFLLVAVLAEAAWLVNVAALYRAVYRVLGIEERLPDMLLASAAANFVNVVTPTVGMGGMAVFISEARRKNYSSARTTVASALYLLFDYAGYLVMLALGLLVLFRRGQLQTTELLATGILVLIALFIAAVLYLGMLSEKRLGKFLERGARLVNRIVRPFRRNRPGEYLSVTRAHTFAHDVAEGMSRLRGKPRSLLWPTLLSLSGKSLLIIVMCSVFFAFDVPASTGTILAAVSIAFLFTVVSPTPNGVGVVEGVLTLLLASFFIPLGEAAIIAITYRGVTYWMPLGVGMLAMRWLSRVKRTAPPPESDPPAK